jgi:hypothetical protein
LGFVLLAIGFYSAEKFVPTNIYRALPGISRAEGPDISGIPVKKMLAFFGGDRTDAQAHSLMAPFMGAIVDVRGRVVDVSEIPVIKADWLVTATKPGVIPSVILAFPQTEVPKLSRLEVDDPFHARCTFDGQMSQWSISFGKCSLLDR